MIAQRWIPPLARLIWISLIVAGAAPGFAQAPATLQERLLDARNWAYQIQRINVASAVDALAAARYDVVVIEPTRTEQGEEDFPAAQVVARLKASPGTRSGSKKIVLAYINVGEAEDWRYYWAADWRAPTATAPGSPDFLVAADPGDWAGCYPVAFWDSRWQAMTATGADSVLDKVLDDGFDGVYMDWVEGYAFAEVVAAAQKAGKNPENEMVAFVKKIRDTARARNPQFLIVPQNAPELGRRTDWLALCDAIGQEDVFFSGAADTAWGDPRSGDVRTPDRGEWSREAFHGLLAPWRAAGKPVLQVSYALKTANIDEAHRLGLGQGYVMFVSQTPLDRVPAWREPPGWPPSRPNAVAGWRAYP